LLLFFVLYKYKKNDAMMSNNFQWTFGGIVNPYKPKFYYWEVVMLIRKTIYVSLVDLTNGLQKLERGFILVSFFTADLYLDFLVKPYHERNKESVPIFEIRTL
jgi:hypothetical protein